jgi:hypothetical protein
MGPRISIKRFLDPSHQQRRHEAGEEAAWPDDDGVEGTNGLGDNRVNGHLRLEPDPSDFVTSRLPRVHFDFTTRDVPSAYSAQSTHAPR